MARGDSVKALIDVGEGKVIERIFEADKAGRTVDFAREDRKNLIVVTVRKGGTAGTPARTIELRADRVIMIEEVPK